MKRYLTKNKHNQNKFLKNTMRKLWNKKLSFLKFKLKRYKISKEYNKKHKFIDQIRKQ